MNDILLFVNNTFVFINLWVSKMLSNAIKLQIRVIIYVFCEKLMPGCIKF